LPPGAQPEFAFADRLDQQFITGLQTGRRAALRRDHDETPLIDPRYRLYDSSPPAVIVIA